MLFQCCFFRKTYLFYGFFLLLFDTFYLFNCRNVLWSRSAMCRTEKKQKKWKVDGMAIQVNVGGINDVPEIMRENISFGVGEIVFWEKKRDFVCFWSKIIVFFLFLTGKDQNIKLYYMSFNKSRKINRRILIPCRNLMFW